MPDNVYIPCYVPATKKIECRIESATGTGVNTVDAGFVYGVRPLSIADHIAWGLSSRVPMIAPRRRRLSPSIPLSPRESRQGWSKMDDGLFNVSEEVLSPPQTPRQSSSSDRALRDIGGFRVVNDAISQSVIIPEGARILLCLRKSRWFSAWDRWKFLLRWERRCIGHKRVVSCNFWRRSLWPLSPVPRPTH